MRGIISRYARILLLTVAVAAPVLTTACASRGRGYYSPYGYDSSRWNSGEDRYYRQYLRERRRHYREFRRLNRADQRDYWNWRHDHR
jgi:hypothetical protein